MKLYELTEAYINILEMMEEEAPDEMVMTALDQVEDALEDKADNIAKVLRSMDSDIAGLKSEEDRLSKRRKSLENNQKRLKAYLEGAMVATDKKKFKTDLFSFGIQKNPARLQIDDGAEIPEEFIKIEKSVDKTKLKEAVKEGLEVQGVHMVQTESLRIR